MNSRSHEWVTVTACLVSIASCSGAPSEIQLGDIAILDMTLETSRVVSQSRLEVVIGEETEVPAAGRYRVTVLGTPASSPNSSHEYVNWNVFLYDRDDPDSAPLTPGGLVGGSHDSALAFLQSDSYVSEDYPHHIRLETSWP